MFSLNLKKKKKRIRLGNLQRWKARNETTLPSSFHHVFVRMKMYFEKREETRQAGKKERLRESYTEKDKR